VCSIRRPTRSTRCGVAGGGDNGVTTAGGLGARRRRLRAGDPSYFAPYGKVKAVGRLARAICLMDHPIAGTNDVDSVQVSPRPCPRPRPRPRPHRELSFRRGSFVFSVFASLLLARRARETTRASRLCGRASF